jgi:hypothetical protein
MPPTTRQPRHRRRARPASNRERGSLTLELLLAANALILLGTAVAVVLFLFVIAPAFSP